MDAHVKHTAEGVLVHVAGGLQPRNLNSVHHRPQRGVRLAKVLNGRKGFG
jgi:hypothetical protein